ncbi:MAG: methionyl-tRNA formyltransferase [Bacteroidales bacterium]|nr:methionyl-tRNA formyltransferase [Bacteroidales bacterium]
MKKLDQFILKSFVGPFVAILVIVVFILMLQFLWVYIDELVGKGLSFKVIMEFMFWGSCTTLPLCLPLATLLGSVMTIGQMAENSELMAIKSAGISLTRVMMPIFAASLLIAVAAFFVGNNLVPKAYNEIYTLRDDIGRTKNEIKIPAGTFYDGIDGYVLRVKEQDHSILRDVMVYDHTNNKGNTSLSLADSAVIKMSKNKDYLIFTLYNGVSYMETNTRQFGKSSLELQHIDFDKQDLVIPLENYSFEKSDSSRYGDQAKAMKLTQLSHQHDSLGALFHAARDNKYKDIRRTGPFILRDELDTAKLAKKPRSAYFSDPMYMKWKRGTDKEQAYSRAIDAARRAAGEMHNYETDTFEYNARLKRTDIELYKKFAQALACLMLFFIGAPLGALIRKGGLGTSVIVAVLFFVLYWVVDISGTKLARDGSVDASIGTLISAVVLAPIGFFLTNRAIHDATFFDTDLLKTSWRKITSLVGRFFKPKRIVFMGTPEFAVASLDALVKKRYKVVAVVTVADKPAGRGLRVQESAVKQYAVAHGIPVLQPLKLKDPAFLSELASYKPDLFVVVAFRMLPEEVWKMPKFGSFNLHAALLPQYRGAAPINWAVINGEKISGVTTFMLDKDIDTGGILLRQECRITPEDTAGSLHDKLMPLGAQLVIESVEGIFQRNIETRVQRSFIQGSEVLHPAPKLTKENTRIDWSRPTREIYNLVRGLSPYPSAWTTLVSADGTATECKLFFGTELQDGPAPAESGTIASDGKTYLAVATGDGWYSVTELQLSGKKRLSVADFLRGFRSPELYRAV